MSKPTENPPISPCELVRLWDGMSTEFGESNPKAAEALKHCATQLAAWINFEGIHALMCMPPAFLRLIQAAHAYDPNNGDMTDLHELVECAIALQTGPS